jgi:2-polyprenyl-3-methyl-5-hydroxy-6-metoxy-1,4-benzoquinol methylase
MLPLNEASKSLSDFRTELYERYVSTFKRPDSDGFEADLRAYLGWCELKYGPLLEGLPRDGPVLELGCGPGDMLEFLRRTGFSNVEGIDLSKEQIRIARDRGLNARVADVFECLASAPQRYRAILAVDFVEHFSKDELMRLVPAIRGALEPGGVFILQTPNGEGLFPNHIIYGDLTHLTIFTPDSLQQLFSLWGFNEFSFVETGPAPKKLKGKLRVLAWRLIKLCANLVRKIESGKTQAIWTENMICRCTKSGDKPIGERV